CSSLKLCSPEWKPGDIGQPIAGTQFRIRDGKDNDAPPGTVGELLIVGAGVAIAAIDDASVGRWLTVDGQRAYRTGDLVIERSDGFTYVGRRDRQVQLRGKRVQLEGIEHVLMGVSGVDSARVTVERGQLRAHYEGNAPLDRVEAVVKRNLRPHERPIVAHRERLPRTSTLKAADEGHDANVDGLARIVANATGLTAIDVDAPIGTLGIDSVDRLTIGLQAQALGLSVAPDDLDDSETLAQIARHARPSGIDVSMLDDWAEAEFQRLRPKDWPNKKKRSGPEGSAFLISGATGMLGTTFIEALQRRGHRALICLSRRASVRDDIEVVRGDITQPLWGLHPTVIEALRDRVGHVVHLAGAVDLVRNYRALHPSNVRGTVHAIELAGRLGARLHYASSLSVFAESTAVGDFSPTTSLKAAQRVTSGYAQSKWVA
ncbi:MAG: SDR family oxidoreductase, partial [Myxococcota bacterium]